MDLEKGIIEEAMSAPDSQVPAMATGGEKEPLSPDLRVQLQLEKTRNSQDSTMESEQALVAIGDTGVSPPTQPVENGTDSTVAASKERKNFDLKLSVVLITFSMIPLTDILFLHGSTAKLKLTLKLSGFFAFTALMSSFCLLFHTLKPNMSINPPKLIQSQLRVSKILYATAASSLLVTCTIITYSILPKAYYFLPLALIPSLLVGGFHFFYGNGEIISAPVQIKALKKELKRATQLTLSLVSASFSGFVGVLLAIYHKAASLGAAYSYVKFSVCLLLGGGVAGVFALLLCRLLPTRNDDNDQSSRTCWQRAILAAANVVMVTMLVSAVLMIAETILHGLLIGAVSPVIAGAVAWLLVAAANAGDGFSKTEDAKAANGTMYAIAVAVASLSFSTILAIFAGLLGGTVSKEQLKACTFFLASAFVSAASLGTVTFGTAWAAKTKASTAFAATVLACCSLGFLVLAALALFYQIVA